MKMSEVLGVLEIGKELTLVLSHPEARLFSAHGEGSRHLLSQATNLSKLWGSMIASRVFSEEIMD